MKMLGSHLRVCPGPRHCSCNPNRKEAKFARRRAKRRERQAWKKDA